MSRSRGAAFIVALIATMTTGCSGCSKKDDAAPDAQAFLASLMDAGDGGGKSDAGIDDAAMPTAVDADLEQRMTHLLEAVAQDNPDLAGDALFPRDGYVQAKDSSDPQKAWDNGVQRLFKRSVESMHNRMKGVEHAKYTGFEIGHQIIQLSPGRKNFKKPLWRVKHSKIKCTIEGKEHTLDIAEMTAWRGAWYVTRLR